MLGMNLRNLSLLMLSILLVAGVVVTGGCAGGGVSAPAQEAPAQIIEDLTAQAAFSLIQDNQKNPDFVILDVRTQKEVDEGHIENAVNIDFYSKTFPDELDKLDKSKTYLVYCRSGHRSGKTRDMMKELKFSRVYNMLGGIIEWEAEGLPTVK